MLLHIYVKDFGIIDLLKMDFQTGFNVLTGETGAGKSIIIEALQLALGGRASVVQIRSGAEKSTVQATFDIGGIAALKPILEEYGVDQPEDDILVLSREISRSGKNICRVNGHVVALGIYRRIGSSLADLHVQSEQNTLTDQEKHRHLLDRFGGPGLLKALEEVRRAFFMLKEARTRFEKLTEDLGERSRRIDTLSYQLDEIKRANLKPGEDQELAEEKKLLINAEKISSLANLAYSFLYEGGSGQPSVVDIIAQVLEPLKNLSEIDKRSKKILDSIEDALYQVEDAARELFRYRDEIEYSPQRLEDVEERLELIRKLKKKYGEDIHDILDYLDSAEKELEFLENMEGKIGLAERELKDLETAYAQAAGILSTERRKAAKLLEEAVSGELADLEMGKVEFRVAFTDVDLPTQEGAERVEFLISPNPGENLKPLSKIASGGELTRIMLALKALLAGSDEIPVLVFDEADIGVGGRALQSVAEKMSQLGRNHQVISVTHSAQIASYAASHHRIFKEFDGGRTVTRVEQLGISERLEELARMLGGNQVTEITRQHAEQLLRLAKKD